MTATKTRTRKPKTTPAQQPLIPQTTPAYDALLAESEKQQLPQRYKTDLTTIDREALLAPDAPRFFGWQLREMGTGLYHAEVQSIQMAEAARDIWKDSLWYIYDDAGLTQVNADRMIALLVEQIDLDALLAALVAASFARMTAERLACGWNDGPHSYAAAEARMTEKRAKDHYEYAQTAKAQYRRL